MKFDPPANENYAAVVVQIKSLVPLPGLDNLVGAPLLGYQAIVSKDVEIGDIGILFTAETQLSEEYARINNLHRHSNLNTDQSAKGYLEDNRRIKAIRFKGNRSDALFMPLSSVAYTLKPPGGSVSYRFGLDEVGMSFDTLNGHEICRKYELRKPGPRGLQLPKASRVDEKFMPKHFETDNLFRNLDKLNRNDRIYITQKLHGTSIRVGHTLVTRKLSWLERVAKKLGVKVQETEYDYVYGSRNVIKDAENPDQQHFYGFDLWSFEGHKLRGLLPKGYIVYGELIGWTPDKTPIQKGYTYGIPEGKCELYVYRVAYINPEGQVADLSWDQVKEFCNNVGLKHVPQISTDFWYTSFATEWFLDKNFVKDWGRNDLVPVGEGLVDEGICIRRDGLRPLILKAKSPIFLQHETKMLDKEEVDMEVDA